MIAGHNPFGIAVALGYLAGAWLAAIAAFRFFRSRPAGRAAEQATARGIAWASAGLLLLGLGLVKIFRIEAIVTGHFRALAILNRQYEDRRDMQRIDVLLALAAAAVLAAALLFLLRKAGERALVALAIALLLVAFVGVRTVSLHDIDALLAKAVFRLSLSNVVELAGIAAIAVLARSRPHVTWAAQGTSAHRRRRR